MITSEIREANAGANELITSIDAFPATLFDQIRSPSLNSIAIDLTALGSVTVVTAFSLISAVLIGLKKLYLNVIHLVAAAFGSALLTFFLKAHFERTRPDVHLHLVDVQGYSYPSGHSLASAAVYFTFAVLLCGAYRRTRDKLIIVGIASLMIVLIAVSRVYLGVHYISDVLAGVFIGIGWASLLGVVRTYFELKRTSNMN